MASGDYVRLTFFLPSSLFVVLIIFHATVTGVFGRGFIS